MLSFTDFASANIRSYANFSALRSARRYGARMARPIKLNSRHTGMIPEIGVANLRVIVTIDDGTFRAAFRPITKGFIVAPDGSFVGEPQNES
jgi:hypothetical protein